MHIYSVCTLIQLDVIRACLDRAPKKLLGDKMKYGTLADDGKGNPHAKVGRSQITGGVPHMGEMYQSSVLPSTVYVTLLFRSQCSTLVHKCCKGDVANQWEITIFGYLGLRSS